MKNRLLYLAIFLLVLSIPVYGNKHEVSWLWADLPWIPFTFVCMSLICIGVYIFKSKVRED